MRSHAFQDLSALAGVLLGVLAGSLHAQAPAGGSDPSERVDRARTFLATLETDEMQTTARRFDHPSRHGWSFFPKRRETLRIGDLDAEERAALRSFLLTALGAKGVAKLEEVLVVEAISDRGGGVVTGPEEYHLTFFGTPSASEPWAWRLEGHHVALNQTLVGGRVVSATPSFLGSFPLRNKDGLEPLRREVEGALAVVKPLEGALRDRVLIEKVPGEIVTGMKVEWRLPEAEGVTLDRLPEESRTALRALAAEHASVHAEDVSNVFLEGWDRTDPSQLHFAWFGSVEREGPHGYRLQGPEWVMEYVNVQARANHVHAVWRTLDGEFIPVANR